MLLQMRTNKKVLFLQLFKKVQQLSFIKDGTFHKK